jgi:hypothetical protein
MDEGLPIIQALIRGLGDQFAHLECLDESHRLVHILFFQYTSLYLLRRWPFTIVIDCTYTTNRFGLYLCQIVGVTALTNSFTIGQAFLSSESTEAYTFVAAGLLSRYGIRKPNIDHH